jgi:hypothetical protein
MDDERFLNSYHNASRPPGPDVPADLAGFILAHAHQGAATQLIGDG